MFDLLLINCTIVSMDSKATTIKNGAIGITKDRIAAIGESADLRSFGSAKTLDLEGKFVFPGLINTHTHLFQTLCRGLADDVPLFDWFRKGVAPIIPFLNEETCRLAALLGCIEAIRSGTTCINDFMYAHPKPRLSDSIIRAMTEVGIRGVLSRGIVDSGRDHGLPDSMIQDLNEATEDCERVFDNYEGKAEGRIHVWIAPASIWMASPVAFERSNNISNDRGIWLTWHMSETRGVVEYSRQKYGNTETRLLREMKFLKPNRLAVHSVWLEEEEIDLIAQNQVKISHCPVSNMYLSDGVARVPQLARKGVTISLGTDGSASNNNQDMIACLKTTALLHKVSSLDPTIITAHQVAEFGTTGGARSLGMEKEIGSLEVGKKADLIVLNQRKANSLPSHDPVSTLVYSATQENIETVIIDGKIVMKERKITTVDEEEILRKIEKLAQDLVLSK